MKVSKYPPTPLKTRKLLDQLYTSMQPPDSGCFGPLVNKLATVDVSTCSSYRCTNSLMFNHTVSESKLNINNKESVYKY